MNNSFNTVLYPPVVDTYTPSFYGKKGGKIYFNIPSFNNVDEIRGIQLTLSYQESQRSALSRSRYPLGIKFINFTDVAKQSYVVITEEDLEDGAFEIGKFYKAQLRFSLVNPPSPQNKLTETWLLDNIENFSEWSRITLVKGLLYPHLELDGFQNLGFGLPENIYDYSAIHLSGKLTFGEKKEEGLENEYLSQYRIVVEDNQKVKLFDSKDMFVYFGNTIDYEINKTFEPNEEPYLLKIYIKTNNGYESQFNFFLRIAERLLPTSQVVITPQIDTLSDRVILILSTEAGQPIFGNYSIKRSSGTSDFKDWEDLYIVTLEDFTSQKNVSFVDPTVQTGEFYQYGIQRINTAGQIEKLFISDKKIMIPLNSIYLLGNDRQLNLKLNGKVSSLKKVVSEGFLETLGSKYPFIRRNGILDYHEFSISGTISSLSELGRQGELKSIIDSTGKEFQFYQNYQEKFNFYTKDEILNHQSQLYDDYAFQNNLYASPYEDYVYEKKFRDKAIDFLYDGKPKLLRTISEGNFLVQLMEVSLTPEEGLQGLIYNFTATAKEIDAPTISNFHKYGILQKGKLSSFYKQIDEKIGQYTLTTTDDEKFELISFLRNKDKETIESIEKSLDYLTWMRINFLSPPQPYIKDGNEWKLQDPKTKSKAEDLRYGFVIQINDENSDIFIDGKRRFYEVIGSNIKIHKLYIKKGVSLTIDYKAAYSQRDIAVEVYQYKQAYEEIGQEIGLFYPENHGKGSLKQRITDKHTYATETERQSINYFNKFSIETTPGAIVKITIGKIKAPEENPTEYEYIVGETGVFTFEIPDRKTSALSIKDISFGGYELNKRHFNSRQRVLVNEFVDNTKAGPYGDVNEIKDPLEHNLYKVNNNYYLYWRGGWEPFTPVPKTSDEILTGRIEKAPIEALIDYELVISKEIKTTINQKGGSRYV